MSDHTMDELVLQLEHFAARPSVQAELLEEKTPNFWSILEYGRGSYETRFCKMLRWLLDPTANHGLGDAAMRWIADFAQVQLPDDHGNYAVDSQDGAETEALGKRIDIFAHDRSAGLLVVIEAKMAADEHDSVMDNGEEASQLYKYYDAVTSHAEYGNKESYPHVAYIFLTEDGHQPPSFEKEHEDWHDLWRTMSYEDLSAMLDDLLPKLVDLDAMKIVKDFKVDVQRNVASQEVLDEFENYADAIALLHTYFLGDDDESDTDSEPDQDKVRQAALDFQEALGTRMPLLEARALLDMVYRMQQRDEQDHSVNCDVQYVARRIFNLYALNEIDITEPSRFGKESKEERISPAKPNTGLVQVSLTRGKGQGLHFLYGHDEGDAVIYLSGDTKGNFPNDPARPPRDSGLPRLEKSTADELRLMSDEKLRAQVDQWLAQSLAIWKVRHPQQKN